MITLQNFTFPETMICTEHDLYYRAFGGAGYSQGSKEIWLGQGARLTLDTYFNLLNIGKWHQNCHLDGLYAEIIGSGLVEIRVFQAFHERSREILYCEVVTLDPASPHRADLSHYATASAVQGLVHVEIKALDKAGATVTGGRFATRAQVSDLPQLAVSITTFKREHEVRNTVSTAA